VGLKILIFAAAMASANGVAFACEPIGEPKPWSPTGLAQFVAVASSPRTGVIESRADLVVGRNGGDVMTSGPIALVPWSHGTDCKPLVWSQPRDGVWSPPATPAFYTGRLRTRDAWINGMPTIDIEMARLQPVWHGGKADRQRFGATEPPLLTPLEFFDFYRVLPTDQELDVRQPQALTRVEGWVSTHAEMAGREPVRSMLRTLRMMWARSTTWFKPVTPSSAALRPANKALESTARQHRWRAAAQRTALGRRAACAD
jgi:hypothetical protein